MPGQAGVAVLLVDARRRSLGEGVTRCGERVRGWIKGTWQTTESGREAKTYDITRAGRKASAAQAERWRQLAGLVDRLLGEEG